MRQSLTRSAYETAIVVEPLCLARRRPLHNLKHASTLPASMAAVGFQ